MNNCVTCKKPFEGSWTGDCPECEKRILGEWATGAQAGQGEPGSQQRAGYAALREDVERRLAQAQREINSHTLDTSKHVKAHWYGRAAALTVLLQDDDARMKAPHTQ